MSGLIDISEVVKRLVKYVIEGFFVAIVAYSIPKQKLDFQEILGIGLSAAATFSILDTFVPRLAVSARNGAGFAIGTTVTGGIKLA